MNVSELLPVHIEKAIKSSYKTLKQSTVDDIVQEAVNDEVITITPFVRTRKIKADKMLDEDKDPAPFSR